MFEELIDALYNFESDPMNLGFIDCLEQKLDEAKEIALAARSKAFQCDLVEMIRE